jgi:hypothetical protein
MSFDMLLDLDPSFAREWIRSAYTQANWRNRHDDSRDYSRLWLRPDYAEVLCSLYAGALEDSKGTISIEPYLAAFFRVPVERADGMDIWARQDAWLEAQLRANCVITEALQLLFGVICELPADRRRLLITSLLSCNHDFTLFRSLQLEPTSQGFTGSAVSMFETQIDYYKSLLPLCNSVRLLEHRQYLHSLIEQLENIVEGEKKKDFMRD